MVMVMVIMGRLPAFASWRRNMEEEDWLWVRSAIVSELTP
jgi:hypothetical protein